MLDTHLIFRSLAKSKSLNLPFSLDLQAKPTKTAASKVKTRMQSSTIINSTNIFDLLVNIDEFNFFTAGRSKISG